MLSSPLEARLSWSPRLPTTEVPRPAASAAKRLDAFDSSICGVSEGFTTCNGESCPLAAGGG